MYADMQKHKTVDINKGKKGLLYLITIDLNNAILLGNHTMLGNNIQSFDPELESVFREFMEILFDVIKRPLRSPNIVDDLSKLNLSE